MSINEITVAGYRSIRNLRVKLAPVNVIVGPNGCGKTNLYRSLLLIQAAADGTLARTLAEEGGMPSVVWAGKRHKGDPVRVTLGVSTDQFEYQISLGLPIPSSSAFDLDPEVKEEGLWFIHPSRRVRLLERKNSHIKARDVDGTQVSFALAVGASESAFSELREPERFPVVNTIRQEFSNWRFYHHFRTDFDSPIRKGQIGTRTPVLSSDGRDLAAALQTIIEIGDHRALNQSIADAFPNSELHIHTGNSSFSVGLSSAELGRAFGSRELSDGTLKYLCLLAALLTPRPPSFMAVNEPEASLHPDLMGPLARLIALASRDTQLWITTHSEKLAAEVEKLVGAAPIQLQKIDGETVISKNDRKE